MSSVKASPAAEEPTPLELDLKPEIGPRVNKRMAGIAVVILCLIFSAIAFALKLRSDAVNQPNGKTAAAAADTYGGPIAPLAPKERQNLIGSLRPKASTSNDEAMNSAVAGEQSNQPPAGAARPAGGEVNSNAAQRTTRDFFGENFGAPTAPSQQQLQQQSTQHVETEAEEARRLEREAIKGPKVIKANGVLIAQQPVPQTTLNGAPQQAWNPANSPASSSLGDLTTLYKALLPAASAQAPPAAESVSAAGGHGATNSASLASGSSVLSHAEKQIQDDTLQAMRTTPLSPYQISAGTRIPAAMEQALSSNLPGEIHALVIHPVFDTATGRYLLIPAGSRLIGSYGSSVAYGQKAVPVIWTQIVFPDSSILDIPSLVGEDLQGRSGLRGHVNNHLPELFSTAVVSSVIAAVASLTVNRSSGGIGYYPSPGTAATAGAGQSIQETGSQLTRRAINQAPTIEIPARTEFLVDVKQIIRFDGPYKKRDPLLPNG